MYAAGITGELGYLRLMEDILNNGTLKSNRTGVDTIAKFGGQLSFNLQDGFPLLTTKKLSFRWIAEELLWFLRAETTVFSLKNAGVDIWDEWATPEQTAKFGRPEGHLGPIYGHQWRNWGATLTDDGLTYHKDGYDQLISAIKLINTTPDSRRIIVSAWNPVEALQVTLPPCHLMYLFGVTNGKLNLHMVMRSADYFLGVPYNIASYALLCHMVAHVCGLEVGELVVSFTDVHLYENALDVVKIQLTRVPTALPRLTILRANIGIDEFSTEDFQLVGYNPQGKLRAEVAV